MFQGPMSAFIGTIYEQNSNVTFFQGGSWDSLQDASLTSVKGLAKGANKR